MADMIPVFAPDVQICDDNGDPLAGGSLTFYQAGTETARVVYSDPGLTTSLGSVVSLDAGGRAVSGSSLVTIYTGINAFKVVVKNSAGTVLRTHDNLPGALDTSAYAETSDVTGLGTGATGVTTVSADTTLVAGDEGKLYNVNPSGGSKTITLPSAATVGDGWIVGVRHDGSSNAVLLATVSAQVIQHNGTDATVIPLLTNGETMWVQSDGTGWIVSHYVPGSIFANNRHWTVEDQTSTPPGSPTPGVAYLVGAAPSGAWSGFAQHDVAFYTGGSWISYTPPTDCGWTAYDKTDNTNMQFQASAWVALVGSIGAGLQSTAGVASVVFATASDMEAATEDDEAVSPVLQHRHPGHPKCWAELTTITTTAFNAEYGMLGLTDNGAGNTTVEFDTAFSSEFYAAVGMAGGNGASTIIGQTTTADTKTITQYQIKTAQINTSSSLYDVPKVCVLFAGDQ